MQAKLLQNSPALGRRLGHDKPCVRARSGKDHGEPLEYSGSKPQGRPHVSMMRDKNLKFQPCTVMSNEALNLDGSSRLLKLSINDSPTILYGKKIQGVVGSERWIDSYTCPGQLVALKLPGRDISRRLYSIASTPYESRSESSGLAASLIEVVAERTFGGDDDEALSNLGPGAELEVSQVIGRGFSSVLGSGLGLLGALEAGQPLLAIGVGLRGMVPCRALLSWVPVMAHATRTKVSCLYVTPSPQAAAFIPEWDAWREAGVHMQPIYLDAEEGDIDIDRLATQGNGKHKALQQSVVDTLETALFVREGGFNSLAGHPSTVTVLMAGMPGEVAKEISKRLLAKGVSHDRQLFTDVQ